MLYLLLAILSSTMVTVLMRVGSRGEARKPLLAVNYVTCVAVSLLFLRGGASPGAEGWPVALGLGVAGGFLFLAAFLLFQKNVRDNGVALSSAFMKLGVIVPIVLGFTLFREPLRLTLAAGIVLTAAAILLLSRDPAGRQPGRLSALVLLLLMGGMADGLGKFYAAYGSPRLEGHYLLLVFGTALLLCVGLCALQRQKPTPRDGLYGVLLGIPNYFSSWFLLRALASVPASVAYPVFSCGTILLVTLIGILAFNERPDRRQRIAMGIVLAALALLNAAP